MSVEVVIAALPTLFEGASYTFGYSAVALVAGFFIGTALCVIRLRGSTLGKWVSRFYVSFFRGVPLLVQLLVAYYCLPLFGLNIPPTAAAVSTLALCCGAYIAEILRGGFLGVHVGHLEAARMLGFSRWQVLRWIEIPQAVRLTLPALVNEVTLLIKASSLISVVGILELTRSAQNIAATTFRPLELYLAAGTIYFIGIGLISIGGVQLEHRLRARGQ